MEAADAETEVVLVREQIELLTHTHQDEIDALRMDYTRKLHAAQMQVR